MKTRQMMLTAAMGALSVAAMTFVSCANETSVGMRPEQVTVRFSTRAMSDVNTRSEGSITENAVTKVALFGIDEAGNVVHTFPVVENPGPAGTTLTIPAEVANLRAIANPQSGHTLDYALLTEVESEMVDLSSHHTSPFVMGGSAGVTNSSAVNMELVRSIAKIEVRGAGGFEVASVAVANTPSKGHVFAQRQIPAFAQADYTAYPEMEGSVVYVGENSSVIPTSLRVRGTFRGAETAYTFTLTKDREPIEVVRNTAYVVTVTPLSDKDCEVDITVPDWEDEVADDGNIIDFGRYYSVDFHNHTAYTDGSHPLEFVLSQGMKYGLDVIVNSEHGGASSRNATVGGNNEIIPPTWYDTGIFGSAILGDVNGTGASQKMWRWQTIRDYSWPFIARFNETNAATMLSVQGLEWNPPGHEHSSSGVITGQFDGGDNANAMAQFEYMFDNSDTDKTGGAAQGWVKSTLSGHAKSMEAAKWLQDNHRFTSWLVPAHPERQNRWLISDYRDLNDIAPDVFVAFESIPGHQAATGRGGYGNTSSYEKTYTFGGVGVQSAQIGNVWDAMLSEGRRFWLVANSDYHAHVTKGTGDFYPGEYQKTYISMADRTAQGFVDGLRSGNIFNVHGDLIDRLEFSVGSATMGQTYTTDRSSVKVRILVRDPETANNNVYTSLTNPSLDHIDLIAGKMRSKVAKGSPEYSNGKYADVKVVARFDADGGIVDGNGITSVKWEDLGGGLKLVEYTINITGDTYFRLRGTNHGLGEAGETDANGNPLVDNPTANVVAGAESAFEDLWFYSNPIFVKVK